ncbi:MAG: hypothetical protein ACLUGB_01970 [Bacilli bacterium]|jgi:hypothetical protein
MNKLEKVALAVPFVLKLKIQNNGLKSQNESLKSTIQDELYKTFMNKLGEPQEIERLKKENRNLRKKVKELNQIIKSEAYRNVKKRK